MRTKYLIPGLVLPLAFTAAATALAVPPPGSGSAVTLEQANPAIVVYSGSTTLRGRVSGNDASGVTVRLEQDTTRPYGDSYQLSGLTATTANNGKYSFTLVPPLNTQYRVRAQASPPVTSTPKLVRVRTRVSFKAFSDRTPQRGRRVRFSGSVYPAHDGRWALIQRRNSNGRFVTVARTTLRDEPGDARSSYSRRIRIYRDGVFRVKVASHSDHINGFSKLRSIDVHR